MRQGTLANGLYIGAGRLLFNGVVPPEKSTAYTASPSCRWMRPT